LASHRAWRNTAAPGAYDAGIVTVGLAQAVDARCNQLAAGSVEFFMGTGSLKYISLIRWRYGRIPVGNSNVESIE